MEIPRTTIEWIIMFFSRFPFLLLVSGRIKSNKTYTIKIVGDRAKKFFLISKLTSRPALHFSYWKLLLRGRFTNTWGNPSIDQCPCFHRLITLLSLPNVSVCHVFVVVGVVVFNRFMDWKDKRIYIYGIFQLGNSLRYIDSASNFRHGCSETFVRLCRLSCQKCFA